MRQCHVPLIHLMWNSRKIFFLWISSRVITSSGYKHTSNRFALTSGRKWMPFCVFRWTKGSQAAKLNRRYLFNLIFQKKILHKIEEQQPLSPTFQFTYIIALTSPWLWWGSHAKPVSRLPHPVGTWAASRPTAEESRTWRHRRNKVAQLCFFIMWGFVLW